MKSLRNNTKTASKCTYAVDWGFKISLKKGNPGCKCATRGSKWAFCWHHMGLVNYMYIKSYGCLKLTCPFRIYRLYVWVFDTANSIFCYFSGQKFLYVVIMVFVLLEVFPSKLVIHPFNSFIYNFNILNFNWNSAPCSLLCLLHCGNITS